MRVRILVQCVTTLNAYSVGEVVDLPPADATSMVSAGLAAALDQGSLASPSSPDTPERRRRKPEERS